MEIKKFDEFVNETIAGTILLATGTIFLGVFFGKMLRKFHNNKYKKIMEEEIIPNIKNGKVSIRENENFIYIDIPDWEIEIDKNKGKVMFLNTKNGKTYQPLYRKTTDTEFKEAGLKSSISFPLDLTEKEFDELIIKLKNK